VWWCDNTLCFELHEFCIRVIKKQQKIQLVIYALMKVKKSLFSYTTDERTNATGFLPGKPINLWVLSVLWWCFLRGAIISTKEANKTNGVSHVCLPNNYYYLSLLDVQAMLHAA
jgi:hypothetical protein